ncbi:hypothetical protein NMG60_11025284 [Bertholletia excelsa]
MATVVCRRLQSYHESLWHASPNPCIFDAAGLARGPCFPENPSTVLVANPPYEEINHNPAYENLSNPFHQEISHNLVHRTRVNEAVNQNNSIHENPVTAKLEETAHEKRHVGADQNYQMLTRKDLGGWSFLQDLSTTSQGFKRPDKESVYVPPMAKRSSSSLSNESLELCTENLGSETGSETSKGSIFSDRLPDFEVGEAPAAARGPPRMHRRLDSRKVDNSPNFPPPLTTMSNAGSIHFRTHREKGRLIIEAVDAASTHPYLQAERSHGRLRLSILKDCNTANSEPEENEEENNMEQVETEVGEEENEVFDKEEDEEEAEEEDEESDVRGSWEDMDGNSLESGVRIDMENFRRPGRCKEGRCGNKNLCNWEALWVATSS